MIFEEIMSENFPKLMKVIKSQIQEALYTLSRINVKENPSRYIVVKLMKTKDKEKS